MSGILTINSNLASLNAQRRFGESTTALSKGFEQFSSGQRINRASDDAAGLSIANSLRADSRVYTQAVRNVNDGTAALVYAEGAMTALGNVVVRLKELARPLPCGTGRM